MTGKLELQLIKSYLSRIKYVYMKMQKKSASAVVSIIKVYTK